MSSSNSAVCLPAPALRPFIKRYVGSLAYGLPPGTHVGLPSRHVDLIISLGQPIDVIQMPNTAQQPATFSALVSSGRMEYPRRLFTKCVDRAGTPIFTRLRARRRR